MAAQNPANGNLTNEQTWRRKTRQMETLVMNKLVAQNSSKGNLTNKQLGRRKTRQKETLGMNKHGDATLLMSKYGGAKPGKWKPY